jgi:hypothetical protein
MRTESSAPIIVRAHTAWRELWVDVLLLVIGCSFPVISFVIDMRLSQRDWFQRSGAVTVLFAALVGYRSLAKHYRKLYLTQNSSENRYGTSRNQLRVDYAALALSLVGTAIRGYGDKLF